MRELEFINCVTTNSNFNEWADPFHFIKSELQSDFFFGLVCVGYIQYKHVSSYSVYFILYKFDYQI